MALYANCLFNIGRVEVQLKKWDAAMSVLSEAWRSARDAFGETHAFVAQALDLLGFVQFSTAHIKSAVVSFKGSLQIYQKLYGDDHEEVANSLCNIGMVREVKGDLENAWSCYSRGDKIYGRIGTPWDDPGYESARRSLRRLEHSLRKAARHRRQDRPTTKTCSQRADAEGLV